MSDPLSRLLAEAGVDPDSVIRVTGPHGLPTLIWLCRHGYQQVGYVRADAFPAMAEAQVLLVAGVCDAPALESLLDHGPRLCDGGRLIVQTTPAAPGSADAPHRRLRAHGYVVERRLHRRGRDVWLARRPAGLERAA